MLRAKSTARRKRDKCGWANLTRNWFKYLPATFRHLRFTLMPRFKAICILNELKMHQSALCVVFCVCDRWAQYHLGTLCLQDGRCAKGEWKVESGRWMSPLPLRLGGCFCLCMHPSIRQLN